MKKKILAIVLIFAFVFTSSVGVYAKGARSFGGSRSFSKSFSSSKSFSKSSGLSGSSKSKSSSSRSIPGSKASSGSTTNKTAAKGFTSKTASKKYSYMQDTYKKQVSSKNFNTYKQKLNTDQQKVYNDTLNRDYGTSSRRMGFESAMNTRSSRFNTFGNRPIFVNVNTGMFGSPFSHGYAFVGPWDLWFLMRASEMFWFHHWSEISPYRSYFDQQKYNQLENRVKELEQQGVKKDPNYLDPNVDPDIQLSQQYQEQNVDKVFYTDKYPTSSKSSAVPIVIIIITSVVLIIVIKRISKPKPKKTHYSKIY